MKVQRDDLLDKINYTLSSPTFLSNFNSNFIVLPLCEFKLVQIYINSYVVLGYSDFFPRRAWWWHIVNEPTFLIPLLRHDTCVVKSIIWHPLYINQSINQSNLFLRLQYTACHGRECFVLKTPNGSETAFSTAHFNAGLRSAGAEQTRDHGAQQDALEGLAMRTGEVPVSHQFLSHFFRDTGRSSAPPVVDTGLLTIYWGGPGKENSLWVSGSATKEPEDRNIKLPGRRRLPAS